MRELFHKPVLRHGLDLWYQPYQPQLRRAGVPRANSHRDGGVSGSIGIPGRQRWHQLDVRLAGGEALVVGAIDRIGRIWQDTGRGPKVLWGLKTLRPPVRRLPGA